MSINQFILLSSIVLIVGCGGGASDADNLNNCRNYASTSITDGGITETCEFNRDNFELHCNSDSGIFFYKVYPSIKDFVLESKTLGLFKTTMRVYNDQIVENYIYEANQLKVVNIDFSAIYGANSHITITHDDFDSLNRPISGTTTSSLGIDCNGNTVSLDYVEAENKVHISKIGSCPFFHGIESLYDNDGNLIEHTVTGSATTIYTVQAIDQVCF